MKESSFDKIGGAVIITSIGYTVFAATSWEWFPNPGDWGDIARIPASIKNYVALLLPPVIMLIYLVVRRRLFESKSPGSHRHKKQNKGKAS